MPGNENYFTGEPLNASFKSSTKIDGSHLLTEVVTGPLRQSLRGSPGSRPPRLSRLSREGAKVEKHPKRICLSNYGDHMSKINYSTSFGCKNSDFRMDCPQQNHQIAHNYWQKWLSLLNFWPKLYTDTSYLCDLVIGWDSSLWPQEIWSKNPHGSPGCLNVTFLMLTGSNYWNLTRIRSILQPRVAKCPLHQGVLWHQLTTSTSWGNCPGKNFARG